jgi:hypothetical protein
MASTKTRTALHTGTALTAGAASITSAAVDLSANYGAIVDIRLTNGGTAPTVAAQVQVQVAADAAGTLWVNFGGPLGGSTTANAVSSWSVDIPIGVAAVRTVSGSNTGQAVTLDADVSGVTGV